MFKGKDKNDVLDMFKLQDANDLEQAAKEAFALLKNVIYSVYTTYKRLKHG